MSVLFTITRLRRDLKRARCAATASTGRRKTITITRLDGDVIRYRWTGACNRIHIRNGQIIRQNLVIDLDWADALVEVEKKTQ